MIAKYQFQDGKPSIMREGRNSSAPWLQQLPKTVELIRQKK